MSKLKEGAITALAEGANKSKSTLYAINEILTLENKINEEKMRIEIKKRSKKIEDEQKHPLNTKKLAAEAKEYVENDGMYRE